MIVGVTGQNRHSSPIGALLSDVKDNALLSGPLKSWNMFKGSFPPVTESTVLRSFSMGPAQKRQIAAGRILP